MCPLLWSPCCIGWEGKATMSEELRTECAGRDTFEGTKCKGRDEGGLESSQRTEQAELWLGPGSDDQAWENQKGPEMINRNQRTGKT